MVRKRVKVGDLLDRERAQLPAEGTQISRDSHYGNGAEARDEKSRVP
jgi:hypothetical protein